MANEQFQSTKLIEGFSTCFRQWKAQHTHCAKLHGYAISFKVTFAGPLDLYNWVVDFGFMKRSKTKMKVGQPYGNGVIELSPADWFNFYFDHKVVVAESDPALDQLLAMELEGVMDVRILPAVGCEMFAKFVYDELNKFLYQETGDRVRVVSVECFEHSKNSAIYTNQ